MKIRHLLLGLMICVAGIDAIDLSGGYLDDQNTAQLTPFLIFGHVLYEDGAPCNSPNVSMTNLNTGAAWYADTVSDSNFYQTLLTLVDVSAGDVIRWSTTDGTVFDTANCTVDQGDIEGGGIFDFDVILQSIAPGIIGYSPESPVHDIENATRTFNITIDQVVDVAWRINGSPIHTNKSVTDASYTHTNVAIGVWNISANVSNANGTDMQEWIWDVVSATALPPAAPFMVCGWVNYEGGGVCEDHAVNITNLNASTRWQAETRAGYGYHELILDSGDVSAGNVLEFNVTDGAVVNTTNYMIDLSNLDSGGIFGFNMTLQSMAPRIIGYAPESPVYDAENVTRRFNITIDQVVNVTWLINGTEVQTDGSVTDASYTNISAAIGVWNVSARASNENGAAMQEWLWNVTKLLPPNITSFAPPSPVRDMENATRRFDITIDQVVNVTWLINETNVQTNESVADASYTTSAVLGVRNVSAIVTNQNGTDTQEWIWHVTPYVPPPSPIFVIYGNVFYVDNTPVDAPCVVVTNQDTGRWFVADNLSGSNFYQIITDASEMRANDTLLIDASKAGVLVENGSVEHTVTLNEGRSGAVRVNINRGLVDLQVVAISAPTYIFDGRNNTINATIANNGTTDSGRFNVSLAADGVVVDKADIESLDIGCVANVAFNWIPFWSGNHTLTVTADSDGEIDESDEANNATSVDVFVGVPDFTVIDVTPDPGYCVIGDTVRIDASVANVGDMGETAVVKFYDNGTFNPNITRSWNEWEGYYGIWYNDTIALPGALAIRLHFSNIGSDSTIHIYDKNGSKVDVKSDVTWTDWIPGDVLRIEEQFATFTIDRYQALIANKTINLTAGEEKIVTASYRNATQGFHDLYVAIDPHNTVPEYDETNNSCAAQVYVEGFDLEVVDFTVPLDDLYVDDVVNITAIIENHGTVDAGSFTVVFEDELVGGDTTIFNETLVPSLSAGSSINITVPWNLTGMGTSEGDCEHNITVGIPLGTSSSSRHWPKDDNNMANNILLGYVEIPILAKYDFTVETVTVAPSEIREGEVVNITAIIGNHGHRGGNVSVGFYIDMWGNILGREVVPLAYCDCLGAARGWSRDNVSNATGRYIRIGSGDAWVDVNDTNTTSITWNADTAEGNHTIMVVADPDERLDEYNPDAEADTNDIENWDFGNNMQNCSLNITPPDLLSITSLDLPADADVGGMVGITAGIGNNEDVPANSTLWWVVEGDDKSDPKTLSGGSKSANWPITQPQPGAVMMRVHFSYVRMYYAGIRGHNWVAGVDVVDANGQNLYSQSNDSIHGESTETNIWTKWGSGDTLTIKPYVKDYGGVTCAIDKYQVVIGNETITLDANEQKFCSAIWNATIPPGNYTVWADVEDQNMSAAMFVNGTDLAVTDLSVPGEVFDGDNVSINTTIANLGRMDAGGFTVEIYDQWTDWGSYKEPVAVKSFSGLKAGGSRSISVPWTASLKNGTPVSHNHTIRVVVTPYDGLPEVDPENNNNETSVYVKKSRDLSVVNLTFAVDNRTCDPSELVLGDNVTMTAAVDVTNLANCGGTLDVGFYFTDEYYGYYNPDPPDERLIGATVPVSFDLGNGTEYATLNWRIDNFGDVKVPGDNYITVVADPNDKVLEFEDRDNKFCQPIYVRSPDLVVTDITFDSENYEVGDLVNITAGVGNLGDKNESNVTVAYVLSREDEHIELYDYPNDWNYTYTIHAPCVHKMRIHLEMFMRVSCDHLYVYDADGDEIAHYKQPTGWRNNKPFRHTTPWADGDNITVKLVSGSGGSAGNARGFLIDRVDMRLDDRTSVGIDDYKHRSVIWNASRAGKYDVTVTIDPEDEIPEHDELNNAQARTIEVQGADLTVSNIALTINGEAASLIKHGDPVNITATIANIGIRDADNVNVSFSIGDDQINKVNIDLSKGDSINISALWNTSPRDYIGDHTIEVFADCDHAIPETNELNNTLTEDVHVYTPELSGLYISWHPPNPLDEDIVMINATITNSGHIPAEDFTVLRYYDQPGELIYSKTDTSSISACPNASRTYDGAELVYVRITDTNIHQGDLIVYDGGGREVARPIEPCWIPVPGDTARVKGTGSNYGGKICIIHFYAVYPGDLSKVERLDAGSTANISIVREVTSFNHTITVFIDPEDNVPENIETDNSISATMYVIPTRDFTVMNVTAAETSLSDTDTTMITATIANIGIRNGTTNVSFIDYEKERRTYSYWFGKRIAGETDGRYRPPYAPVDPPGRSTTIHRPGADAIEIDNCGYRTWKEEGPRGEIWVYDGAGKAVWHYHGAGWGDNFGGAIPWVEGDTAIIREVGNSRFDLYGYTTIDEFNRTEVTLNATDTWNESRTLTSIRNASTGDHIITVIADPDDEIGEIDELNNNESILIHVNASRDPALINLTNTPLNPSDGDDVAITAEVRNNGNKTANFTIDFWENTSKRYETDSSHIHVPGASFVDIHLDYRWDYGCIADECGYIPRNNVWLGGSLGDTIEVLRPRYGALYVCGVRMYSGPAGDYGDWHDHVNRIQYMKLMNRTHVSLAPNETRNVIAIWEKMSISDAPEYSVIVIVDPEDEIDEIDESNNAMEREIVMNYPDFEIGHFASPTKKTIDARVTIRNTGIGGADDVNVTFELARRDDYLLSGGSNPRYTVRHDKTAHDDQDANHIRVHFDNITVGGGNLKIAKSIRDLYGRGRVIKKYVEDVENVWGPWVEGNKLAIGCNAKSFEIDMYEWGDVEEDEIDHISAYGSKLLKIKMPEGWKYTGPQNMTVRVDPDDEFLEMDEENNEETVIVYKDLAADGITFVSPEDDKLSLDVVEFAVDVTIENVRTLGDDGMALPISNFNVTLEFRHPNGTLVFNVTEHVDETLYVRDSIDVPFTFESDRFNGTYGNLTVNAEADSSHDINELNEDLFVYGEENNKYTRDVHIYERSGYTGGGELINIEQGEVNCRVMYTIGDSTYSRLVPGGTVTVEYANVTSDGVDDIEFARLFVYWATYHVDSSGYVPELADVDVAFNGHSLVKAGNYSDNPGATTQNYGYGLYSYEVADYITSDANDATVTNNADWAMGVSAIGLLVVYEDEDEPLTKYWVNEGADLMMAANNNYLTGLSNDDCITTAQFKEVDREDTENVNAKLLTVMGMYLSYGRSNLFSDEGDALEFNDQSVGSLIGTGHWDDHYQGSGIALTSPKWVDVADHLERGNNLAEVHSTGNYMLANNAFLRLIFPPDLNIINMTAPESTVVGAHHSINVTIRNDGRSDAHDFNVTFYIDEKQIDLDPLRLSDHLGPFDLAAGENMTLHLHNWTPMMLMHVYNLTAAVDVLSGEDWTEIETDNNAMTKHVTIEEGGFGNQTGPRGTGGGRNPTGGEFTEEVTGRVLSRMISSLIDGGGGGAGMFSALEWVMKGAVWLVLLLFVYAGYRMEQRSYGRASRGLRHLDLHAM
ncbi:MAG: hypothetical protein C4B59_13370 [Candidatus Methanogaster sp.]|uniref:Uncharacterized protein n=1 Tax=Candidatus Methanogaster sp. TaxID=3386292 RepID=A0AC61KZU3_9EURY|nr:MAG: hypothetical protein C4B59_13370 [ANME-2 cluster archaeon]